MKNTITIRSLTCLTLLLIFSASAIAAPVVRGASGANVNAIISTLSQFLTDIGGTSHPNGGSFTTGYRVINWDEVPDNVASNSLPPNFFNSTVAVGAVVSSACTNDDFKVSSTGSNGSPLHFGEYNVNYATDFQTIGGPRLFSANAGGCNYVDFTFYIPGTKIPATVTGFGVGFSDVDNNQSAGMSFYGVDGQPIMPRQNVNGFNNGLSFLGVTFNAGERVARVRVFNGNGVLGDLDKSRGGMFDVVVMDTVVFSEPRAIGQHSSDFDGDGTSDYSVFRPSNGIWYVMQSGSNTFTQTQFGLGGDIPVDGDFDGDSRNDLAVFRPSSGVWYILRSRDGMADVKNFGIGGDKPLSVDYDKDGKNDIAVWRPSNGHYYSINSSDGLVKINQFGLNGDIPIGSSIP